MRRILLVLAIIVFVLIGRIEYRSYLNKKKAEMTVQQTPFVKSGLQPGQEHRVETIRIQQGHEFEIKIHDLGWIKGVLSRKSPVLAHKLVIELLNSSTNPRVVLLDELDNSWTVDVKMLVDSQEVSLTSWLDDQGLLFN